MAAHLGVADGVTDPAPVAARFPDVAELVAAGEEEPQRIRLRRAGTVGRPIGSPDFLARLERESGRSFAVKPRGRKPQIDKDAPHAPLP